MYISDSRIIVYEYPLSTAFDISTAGSLVSITMVITLRLLSFDNDGTKLFILTASQIREYSLTTAFDVTTASASYTRVSTISGQDSSMQRFSL